MATTPALSRASARITIARADAWRNFLQPLLRPSDNMSESLITVVLPVYNGAQYIACALQSILAQHDDCEVIVSDDCSSDDTVEIVRSIRSSRVQIITNDRNGGIFV